MTLEDLRILVAVAEAPSMGAAARALGRTQPAVAQHIRRLESELDTALMVRGTRGSTLTEAGELFYRRASLALRALQTGEQELRSAKRTPLLALAASTVSTEHLLKQPILAVRKRWPGLRLRVEMGTTVRERLDAVRQRRVDLALVTLVEPWPGIATLPVVEMPLRLLVHRDHPLAARRRLSLRSLADVRYVALRNSSAMEYVRRRLEAEGATLTVAETVDTAATAILHVELGLGETLVPAHQLPSLASRPALRALTVLGLPATPLGWASLDFELIPETARALIDEVAKVARVWKRG